MNKIEKINKILYTTIFTCFTILIFIINIGEQNMTFYKEAIGIYRFMMCMWLSLKSFDIVYVTAGIFIFYTYYHIYFDGSKTNKTTFINSAVAVILSFTVLIGKSFAIDNTLNTIFGSGVQMVKCAFIFAGYYFAFYALLKKVTKIEINIKPKKKQKLKKKNKYIQKISEFISKHQIAIGIIVVFLCWFPYIIIYLPGASTGDTFDSLCQFFHVKDSWSIATVNLIDEGMYINKHHPVFFTVILGLIFKIGKVVSSFTLGALIYTVLQITFLLICISVLLIYMEKMQVHKWVKIFTCLFFGLTPTIAAYAITAIKDTPSGILTMIYALFLLQIIRNYDSIFNKKLRLTAFIIVMLLVLLLRNNGIYTILMSFPFLFIIYKSHWKKMLVILVSIFAVFFAYDKMLLPMFKITDGSIKEVLTIPFMQIARVAKYKEEGISDKDKKIIDKVLDYESIKKNYDPDLADGVKDTYKLTVTNTDLKNFFKVWFKYLKKYPIIYIEAFLNSTYGYFYPETGEAYATLAVDARIGDGTYFNVQAIDEFKYYRYTSVTINKILAIIPFFNLFNHVAFYDWFLLFSCFMIIRKKKYKYLITLAPFLSVLLVCLASPINGSFRYILPITMGFPLILLVDYLVVLETQKQIN